MKQLHAMSSTSVVCRRYGKYLAVVSALLVSLGTFGVPAAYAKHHGYRHNSQRKVSANLSLAPATVPFNRFAGFSCFGAVGGFPTGSSAIIRSAEPLFPNVTANVTLVHARPLTTYFLYLYTSGCQTFGFASTTTDINGNATGFVYASDRGSFGVILHDAFVQAVGGGDVLITPEAFF